MRYNSIDTPHGEVAKGRDEKHWMGGRWCATCKSWAGFLALHEHYSPELNLEIEKLADKFRSECKSGNINIVINGKNRGKWKDLQPEDFKL